jgi:hypothetical protein
MPPELEIEIKKPEPTLGGTTSGSSGGMSSTDFAQQSLDFATYRLRCPRCQRLYSVHANAVQTAISARSPSLGLRFQCQSENCNCRFEVSLVHENDLLADVLPTRELLSKESVARNPEQRHRGTILPAPLAETPCPKCQGKNALTAIECRLCGVVFAKIAKDAKGLTGERVERLEDFGGRRELADLWTVLLNDYENRDNHDRFIEACYRTGCLGVAAQRYTRILVATPNEELAKTMRRRIMGLASFKMETVNDAAIEPEPTSGFRFPRVNNIILMLGGAAMAMGFLLPGVRDLVGLGAAAVALGVGGRFFLSPRSF